MPRSQYYSQSQSQSQRNRRHSRPPARFIDSDDDYEEEEEEERTQNHRSQSHRSQSHRSQNHQSQNHRSQSRRSEIDENDSHNKGISSTEMESMAGGIILYVLRASENKHHILKSNIQKALQTKSKHFNAVMNEVTKRLKDVFGYNLWEFETGKYILSNDIPNAIPHLTLTKAEKSKETLLFLVLSHIFLSEDSCQEENVYNFLNDLGIITSETEEDPFFGNVRRIIKEEFVPQRYIDKVREVIQDKETYELKWGVRAEQELSLRHIMEFVEEVYNVPMKSFKKQYNAMLAREKNDNQNQPGTSRDA